MLLIVVVSQGLVSFEDQSPRSSLMIAAVLFRNHLSDQQKEQFMNRRLAFSSAVLAFAGVVEMLADGPTVGVWRAVPDLSIPYHASSATS
jgi:hypothetical protein